MGLMTVRVVKFVKNRWYTLLLYYFQKCRHQIIRLVTDDNSATNIDLGERVSI